MKVDYTKLVIAGLTIVGVTVLLALSKIDSGGGLSIITLIIGYVLGNGKSVAQGNLPGSMLAPHDVVAVKPTDV